MGRAPNSGAPQRVSAHVVPKAPSTFPQEDEEEKTTIESGWEDEASTTVEQGEVAEKIRAIEALKTPLHGGGANGAARPNTGITSTNGGALDEPTVDDQRANAALSLLTPSVAPARIVVTAGNDTGQELEIRPGKTYTIGRAIDNDLVLTDIAVSRKHFDLRYEDGKWIVIDRKSGNGTVVNGNIEDGPFELMNGDAIEIGNTQFRFDHANQPSRVRNSAFTVDLDEEESSTVAGKPLRDNLRPSASVRAASELPSPPQMMPRAQLPRPKTVPPPAPLPRPRSPSVASAPQQPHGYVGIAHPRSVPPSTAPPASLPLSGGPIGVPMAAPNAPTVSPLSQMPAMRPPLGQPPAILGENGVVRPQMMHAAHEGMAPLPGVMPTTIPGQGPPVAPSQPQLPYGYPNVGDMQPQLAHLQINGSTPRDATSTALVQPTSYGGHAHAAAFSVAQPDRRVARKVKLALGAALLMVLAAIATIAIIKSGSGDKPEVKANESPSGAATEPTQPAQQTSPTVVAIETAEDPAAKKAAEAKRLEEQRKADEAKALEAKRLDEQRKADERRAEEQRKADERRAEEQRKADERKKAAEDRKADLERRAEERRLEQERLRAERAKRKTTATATTATTTRTRTTTTDVSAAKEKAEALYRSRKFNDAVSVLRSAASSASETEAKQLRSLAAAYDQVGRAYNIGTGPSTPAVEAYTSLQKALNYESQIGIHAGEIKSRLAQVAPRAAIKYMSDKSFELAFKAVRVAEQYGGANSSTESVRRGLTTVANDLYRQAMAEKSINPGSARQRLQRIKGIIDKAPVVAQAEKALRDL